MNFKLFQYDTKTWKDGDGTEYALTKTYQFFVFKQKTLFYFITEKENFLKRGVSLTITFDAHGSLFECDLHFRRYLLSFNLYSEYFDGWNQK